MSKNRLFSGVSHDLATPLNAIIGFSAILKGGRNAEKTKNINIDQYASYIHQSGVQLSGLVEQVFEISSIEEGKWQPDDDVLDLSELITALEPVLTKTLSSVDIRLNIDRPDDLPQLVADQRALNRVLTNLITNCSRYSKGTHVALGAMVNADGAFEISVADDGRGIPEQHLESLRKFGVRAESTDTASDKGLGMGLWLIDTLMLAHGAEVIFSETPETGGLTVTVVFPHQRVRKRS